MTKEGRADLEIGGVNRFTAVASAHSLSSSYPLKPLLAEHTERTML